MDAIDRFGEALLEAGRNDIARRGGVRGRARRWSRRWQIEPATVPRLRILLVASVLLLVLAAIAVAATQTLLIGAQVRTIERPVASAGEGVPTKGGVRLLAIRAPDPAGGVPWGLRVVHTTQGQIVSRLAAFTTTSWASMGSIGRSATTAGSIRCHQRPYPTRWARLLGGFRRSAPRRARHTLRTARVYSLAAPAPLGHELGARTAGRSPSGYWEPTPSGSPTGPARGLRCSRCRRVWARI
jgi:hypothetical protein